MLYQQATVATVTRSVIDPSKNMSEGAQVSNCAVLPPAKKAKNAGELTPLPCLAPDTVAQHFTTTSTGSQSVDWAAWVASYSAECSQSAAEHHASLDLPLQDNINCHLCCAAATAAQVAEADVAAAATTTPATPAASGNDADGSTAESEDCHAPDVTDDLAFLESIWKQDMPQGDAQPPQPQGDDASVMGASLSSSSCCWLLQRQSTASELAQRGQANSCGSDSSNKSTTGSFFIKSNTKHQLAQLEQQLGFKFDDAMYDDEDEVHFTHYRTANWWEYLYNQQQVCDAKLKARSALAASAKARSAVGSKLRGGIRKATRAAGSGARQVAHQRVVSFSEELENVRVYERYGKVTEYEDAALKQLLDEMF